MYLFLFFVWMTLRRKCVMVKHIESTNWTWKCQKMGM